MYVYIFDSGSICIHGKELLRQFTFHQQYSGKSNFEEDVRNIWTVDITTIGWDFRSVSNQMENSPWKQSSLVNDEEVISLSHAKVYVFSDSVLCLGKMNQNTISNTVWERQLEWFKDSSQYRTLDTIDGEPMEFESIIFQDSQHWSLSAKSQSSWAKWAIPNNSKDELSSCRCSMTSCGEIETTTRNVLLIPHFCLYSHKDFHQDVGHSSGLGQKQSGTPLTKKDQEENGIESLNWWWTNSKKADIQFSEQRVRWIEDNSKAKEVENYLFTSAPMVIRLKLCFAQLSSVNQLSIHGAVAELCEEYSICQTSTEKPAMAEQSDGSLAPANLLMMTPTSLAEIPAQENLLQKQKERVENLSQPDQLLKVCTDARFLKTVEVGQ